MSLASLRAAPGASAPLVPEPLDLRLVPAALAAWSCAALAVAAPARAVAATALLAAVGAAGAALVRGRGRRVAAAGLPVLAATSAVALAVLAGGAVRDAGLLPALVHDGARATVVGTVASDPRPVRATAAWQRAPGARRWVVTVRVREVRGEGAVGQVRAPVLVFGGSGWERLRRGDRVRASGDLVEVPRSDDVRALLRARSAPVADGAPGPVVRVLQRLRRGLASAAAPLPADARGLLPGLVVGDTTALPSDLADAMRSTGLTHLTAVSGGNTAVVTATVLVLAGAAGAPRAVRLLAAGSALAGFAALAGAEPSVLRATVMSGTGLAGLLGSRRGAGLPVLAAAVVGLVVADPWLARSAGFVLSVLATGALLLLARPWTDALSGYLPRWLAAAVAVPLAAQLACGPVILLLSPGVAVTAVPANLLAEPAVAPATVLGLAATTTAPLSPGLAELLARAAGVPTGWIARVARTAAAVPGSTLPWPEGWGGAAALAVLTVAGVLAAAAARRRLHRRRRHRAERPPSPRG